MPVVTLGPTNSGMARPARAGQAPILANASMRSARIFPSLSSASDTLWNWSRPAVVAANSSPRSARHFTGRFSTLAAHTTTDSSGWMPTFMPKPPPMSRTITRTLSLGILSTTSARVSRVTEGFWLPIWTTIRSPSHSAITARGSMALTISRWCTMSSDTTWAATLKAASDLAASPKRLKPTTLPGAPFHTCGASGFRASSISVTDGSWSYSTSTSSTASWACSRVSATTATTASPR